MPSAQPPGGAQAGGRGNGARTLRCPSPVVVAANGPVTDHTAPSTSSGSRPSNAKDWLAVYLAAHGGEVAAGEVIAAGRAHGFPASTVKNARPKVAYTVRVGFGPGQKTYWRLRTASGTTAGLLPADTAGSVDPTRTADPAGTVEPTQAIRLPGPTEPTGNAEPSQRRSRPRRGRRRRGGVSVPGAEQPTLFAVMGVSEP